MPNDKIVIKKPRNVIDPFTYLHTVLEHAKFDLTFQKRLTEKRLLVPLTDKEIQYFSDIQSHLTRAQYLVEEIRLYVSGLEKRKKRFFGLF